MRKLLLFVSLFVWMGAFSQTLPYNDDFESYTTGGSLAQQSGTWWTTWSNAPGGTEDGKISEAFAHSPVKAVVIEGSNDQVLKLGNKTAGHYELKWWMYVETGKAGYYNIQHFESPGVEWAFEIYFNADGSGKLTAGDVDYTFSYPKDTWFEAKHDIDLDADLIKLYVNGTMVHEWPFSYQSGSTTGTKQLGGVNFYAGAATGETPKYFFDDMSYSFMPTTLLLEDFEAYAVDAYVAVSNPTWFTTWSNAPGGSEDAKVKDAYSHSPTKSAVVEGSTDLLLKLGNKTSGLYEVTWWMYVEANKAGYYNFQHFESPGVEFAFEIYFNENGSGTLKVEGSDFTFYYPKSVWFEAKHIIDLDNDNIKLYIDGSMVKEWPFSSQASAAGGTLQLGGVDFFAGAATGETPKYYFDDVLYTQAGASSDPIIAVSPEMINTTSAPGLTSVVPLTVSNNGASDLEFSTNVIYVLGGKHANAIMPEQTMNTRALANGNTVADPNPSVSTWNPVTDDFVLHYDGDMASAVGWNTPPVTATVAARFLNPMVLPHAGMVISSIDLFVNDLNTTGSNEMSVVIYGMGTSYEPGTLLYTQTFTPFGNSWEHIVLNTPVPVTGEELWIGYTFTQHDAGIYIPGTDAGPNDPNGDWIKTGIAWSHLSNNPALPYNWNIRANLTGTPVDHWLTVAPTTATVAPGESTDLNVTLNATSLEIGIYEGIIRIVSNDPVTPSLDVPVTLGLYTGIEEGSVNQVAVYPNPATNVLNVAASNIQEVRVMNLAGQVMLRTAASQINVTELPAGTYLIQVTTDNGTANMKFNKK
ncbi:MAG: T9SS type A sorting domain-containing protein [Bacteroidales bacterium]|nr:T9SS type A sorting domain-containing protein [Bacteroidales bacterium]